MSYEILLTKNGQIRRRMGDYTRKADAVTDAQVLADAAAPGVKVYVERRNNPTPRKRAKKTLRDVSKQLAKASKAHSKQSKRVAKIARRLNAPSDDWIQGVDREIEARGTEGAFTAQARRAGYSDTMEFARKVMAGWRSGKRTVYNKKTRRQQRITEKTMDRANFALNVQKRRNPKAAHPKFEGATDAEIASPKNRDLSIRQLAFRYGKTVEEIKAILMRHGKRPQWNPSRAQSLSFQYELRQLHGDGTHAYYLALKQALMNGDVSAGSIIGSGYKSPKRAALKWLDQKIAASRNQNPSVGEIGSAIGRGAKKLGGYVVEGATVAGEEAKRAALYAKFKDLEACAQRLGINTDDLMDGKLDARATLNEVADRIEDAEQNLARYGGEIKEARAKRASKRKSNPRKSYFVGFTRPESGFRYFSKHNLKSAADNAIRKYKRQGYTNVRLTKNRPTKALPVGIFEKV